MLEENKTYLLTYFMWSECRILFKTGNGIINVLVSHWLTVDIDSLSVINFQFLNFQFFINITIPAHCTNTGLEDVTPLLLKEANWRLTNSYNQKYTISILVYQFHGYENSYKCFCISLSIVTADLLCHWIDVYIRTHHNAKINFKF